MPTIPYLNIIPWICSGILLIGALFYRGEYLSEKAARESDIAKAKQAVLDQQAKDAKLAEEIQDRHAQELAKLKDAYNGRVVSIMRAKDSNNCVSSPSINALIDGLRRDSKASPIQNQGTK
jgi:hypothetical protein